MLKFSKMCTLVIGALTLGASVPAVASATPANSTQIKAGTSIVCDRGDIDNVWCFLDTDDFPGGDVAVDVEITNPAQPATRRWVLRADLTPACEADFDPNATPASWVCHNVSGNGWLHLSVPKLGEERAVIGLRWG